MGKVPNSKDRQTYIVPLEEGVNVIGRREVWGGSEEKKLSRQARKRARLEQILLSPSFLYLLLRFLCLPFFLSRP